ncbi:MAG: UTP--glucose-1-phosphate uridylyltransferase GalU [Acidobacteria bacterium]|nr:UTP--glucose-1-phosphate uridylyltransferase GalU [Acidobacteriota bacterium]MCW5971299.1 UTP--glucose-1-phosphate uridylyltransferase GalU [Blastocatellales bacterium]
MAKIRKAVFPAAGLGTRFLPATKVIPKEMLPLVDKPLIQYGVEEALGSGVEEIIFITARGKGALEDHFDISYELEKTLEERGKTALLSISRQVSHLTNVVSVRQKQALGLGHAVLTARTVVGDEPFAVILGDDIIDSETPCLKQMIEVYEKYGGAPVIALEEIEGEAISRFGVIAGEEVEPGVYRLTDMVEKPKLEDAPSNLAIIGRYVLTPDVFELIASTDAGVGGEIQITDALRRLAQTRPFYGLKFKGRRYDAGDKMGFLEATVELALKREDMGPAFRQYLKTLPLD